MTLMMIAVACVTVTGSIVRGIAQLRRAAHTWLHDPVIYYAMRGKRVLGANAALLHTALK
jgi:hypothetical protein